MFPRTPSVALTQNDDVAHIRHELETLRADLRQDILKVRLDILRIFKQEVRKATKEVQEHLHEIMKSAFQSTNAVRTFTTAMLRED